MVIRIGDGAWSQGMALVTAAQERDRYPPEQGDGFPFTDCLC
jgi:hypothetical protein